MPYLAKGQQDASVLIGKVLYSIINLDEERNSQEMYLYLEEVRKLT